MGLYIGNTRYCPVIGKVDSLPYDAEIEYLESSGTQHINTNIVPTANTGIRADVYRNTSNDLYIVGCRNDSGNTRWGICQVNRYYAGYGTNTTETTVYNTRAVLDLNYKNDKNFIVRDYSTLSVDNTISLPTLSFTPLYPIYLFGGGGYAWTQSWGKFNGRIYSAQITQSDTIVMDLIPVRIGQVGYMYDKITNKFFGNAGTGNFILGADVT